MRSHRNQTHGAIEIVNSATKRKIDFHLIHCRSASKALEAGIECPKEFERQSDIRDAAMFAIALEAGITTEIGNAKLTDSQKWRLMGFISGYSSQATSNFAEYRRDQGYETCPCGDMDVGYCAGECGEGDAA